MTLKNRLTKLEQKQTVGSPGISAQLKAQVEMGFAAAYNKGEPVTLPNDWKAQPPELIKEVHSE